MKQWVMAFLFCLLAAADCLGAPVRVRNFDACVDVAGNGDVVVSETLTVDIPDEGEFHGIFRDIPVVTRWRGQGRASLEVLEARLDGRFLPTDDVRREPELVRVYQRDREKPLAPGRHEFFLSYRMTAQVGLFEDNDELTWNVTGSGWEAPIDRASCTVLCPPGAPFFGQLAWLGKAGSRDAPVTMSHETADGRLVMRFEARRAVLPGEDFTVAAGWRKGFVTPEAPSGPLSGATLFALLDAALFLYFFLAWYVTGRDPKKGVIVARFHPPRVSGKTENGESDVLSPEVTGFFFHKAQVTPGCFGAAIISLAGRGCCRIEGNAREGFLLERGEGTSPFAEEKRILELLEGRVPVDREHGEVLSSMKWAMKGQLSRDYGKMWKGAGGGLLRGVFGSVWMLLGVAIAMLSLAAVTGHVTGGVLPKSVMGSLAAFFVFLSFFRHFPRASVNLFRSGRYAPFVFSLLFQAAALGFIGFFLITVNREIFNFLLPSELALAGLALLIPLFFSFIMDAPTKEARALLDEIEGLELYMRMAEGPALTALNPPERTLEHYRELLPYAVALNLERAWGAHFSGALSSAAVSDASTMTPAFAGALSSQADRSVASYASSQSSASSASSFGGGGGAGSGGGGGGGGGC